MRQTIASRLIAAFVLIALLSPFSLAEAKIRKIKTLKIKGYITQVNSPTSFELDEYKISLDGKYDVELQNVEDDALKFDPTVHLRVGTLVKMKCK